MSIKKKISIAVMSFILLSSLIGVFSVNRVQAVGLTIYVNCNGGANYIKIQDAIDHTVTGDTVFVYSGTYYAKIEIDKAINLFCSKNPPTIIDGGGSGNVVDISVDDVNLSGFRIQHGIDGIRIHNASNVTIKDNTIRDTAYGIFIESLSHNNTIYRNNLLHNTQNAYDQGSNSWDDGAVFGGNYWSDYTGNNANSDGFGDTPYTISGGSNKDRYPMMKPFNESPVAGFTFVPSKPTTLDVIRFTDTSTVLEGNIVKYTWNFGDGTASTGQGPTHRYIDNGTYIVTLNVTDEYGVANITSQKIIVLNGRPAPNFIFSPLNPSDLQIVTFKDTSVDLDGNIVVWLWDFGDGFTSPLQNPTHKFNDNGIYTVRLNITDDDRDASTKSQQISVSNVGPAVSFSYSSPNILVVVNDTILFIDTSTDGDGTIVSWLWDFGDKTSSAEKNPPHQYMTGGTRTVTLKVTDNDGASSTVSKYLTVIVGPGEPNGAGEKNPLFNVVIFAFLIVIVIIIIVIIRKWK
ncbi:MAG TPA: hypothetical protein DSN98_01945 [Thermoplasmata archaeon]|nr:MAG TPA: hypothetical protein DSN98_01945 [Thermoplasmata archaeon]